MKGTQDPEGSRAQYRDGYSKERPDDEESGEELLLRLRQTSICMQQFSKVPIGELTALISLKKLAGRKGFALPTEMRDHMKLSSPAVSRTLHTLEKKGYVSRQPSSDDHRFVRFEVTAAGMDRLNQELVRMSQFFARVRSRMGNEDMNQFLHYSEEFFECFNQEMQAN